MVSKTEVTFLIHQNTGKENGYRMYFVLLYLPLYCGDFIEQRKMCHIHFEKQNKYSNFVNYVSQVLLNVAILSL